MDIPSNLHQSAQTSCLRGSEAKVASSFELTGTCLGDLTECPPTLPCLLWSLGLDPVKYLLSLLSLQLSFTSSLPGKLLPSSFPKPRAKTTDRSVLRPGVATAVATGHTQAGWKRDLGSHLNSPGNSAGPTVMSTGRELVLCHWPSISVNPIAEAPSSCLFNQLGWKLCHLLVTKS